jgi:hypothetical protein
MTDQRVIIENETGERYSVTLEGFGAVYAPQGYRIVARDDGTSYGSDYRERLVEQRERYEQQLAGITAEMERLDAAIAEYDEQERLLAEEMARQEQAGADADTDAAASTVPETGDWPEFLTAEQRDNLIDAGYPIVEAALAATDDALLAVAGIGPATVAKLREYGAE